MKLDKRLSRLPYTCFEKDDCEKFVGQMGYFTNSIENYSDLENCYHKRLESILSDVYNKVFYRMFTMIHLMPLIISLIDFSFLMHS